MCAARGLGDIMTALGGIFNMKAYWDQFGFAMFRSFVFSLRCSQVEAARVGLVSCTRALQNEYLCNSIENQ